MTEDRWLTAANPLFMLQHVRRTSPGMRTSVGRRKFRLFSCACARRLGALSDVPLLRAAVEASERFADGGERPVQQTWAMWTKACVVDWRRYPRELWAVGYFLTSSETRQALKVWRSTIRPVFDKYRGNVPDAEKRALAATVRDVFGNPFRPVACDPAWRTSAAVGLAEAIYAGRAFDRLPVLADALEEAGCTNPDVLAHCRADGPHARGCWVVDLILGKS